MGYYSMAGNFQPHTHVVGMDATTSDKEAASLFLEDFERPPLFL